MACSKPSGDPDAISRAADAIVSYADGIDGIFSPIDQSEGFSGDGRSFAGASPGTSTDGGRLATVDLSSFWGGSAADTATGTLSQYREQLNGYTDQLRIYASELQEYSVELRKAQSCDIWQILIWVFLIVFTIAEVVCGFFFGGIIEGALTYFFGPVVTLLSDVGVIVGEALAIVGDVIEGSALFSRIVTEIAEAGASALDFVDIGATLGTGISDEIGLGSLMGLGEVAGDLGEIGGAESGISVGGAVGASELAVRLGESGIDIGSLSVRAVEGLEALADQAGSKLFSFMSDLPKVAYQQSTMFVYKAVYNTAEWYAQELIIRGVSSLDPNSGGFAAMWNGDDEKAEVFSVLAGMAAGSMGYALSDAFLGALNSVMKTAGLDITGLLNSASRSLRSALGKAPESEVDNLLTSVDRRFDDPAYWKSAFKEISDSNPVIGKSEFATLKLTEADIKASTGSMENLMEKADPAVFEAKDEASTEVIKHMFDDVLENAWDYGAILTLYPFIRGEDFDFKELGWYVTYGIVEGLLHPPIKHKAGAITESYVGKLFPNDAESLVKAGHPVLGEAAKNLGDLMIANGLSALRKVTLDPTADIGSFSEYLHGRQTLEDSTTLTPLSIVPVS